MSDWRAIARGFAGRGALPDALIIGAQKCGTSSLFHQLAQHPRIWSGWTKEVHYFDLRFDRGGLWYKGQFRRRPGELVVEGTPYYLFHPLAPKRAAALLPNARLIVLLREPAARAFSHYQHERAKGREPLSFEEALAAESERLGKDEQALADGRSSYSDSHHRFSYFRRGLYAEQIERWRVHYPLERFLFLKAEDLFQEPQQAFERTCAFLGLAPVSLRDKAPRNRRNYEAMLPETRARLAALYKQPNARLERLTGITWP